MTAADKNFTIQTSIEGARRLQAIIAGANQSGIGSADNSAKQPKMGSVIIQVIEEIEADDLQQHDAKLIKIDGNEYAVDNETTVKIRNLTGAPVAAETYAVVEPVSRWGLCLTSVVGGGGIIQFQPLDVCEGIGLTCDCVTARVLTASCGSGISPGDEVQVWDQSRGWFEMPQELLFNSVGWAHKVKVTEQDQYDIPFPLGACRWVVISMDCIEQEPYE
jgi:hypothetical protein